MTYNTIVDGKYQTIPPQLTGCDLSFACVGIPGNISDNGGGKGGFTAEFFQRFRRNCRNRSKFAAAQIFQQLSFEELCARIVNIQIKCTEYEAAAADGIFGDQCLLLMQLVRRDQSDCRSKGQPGICLEQQSSAGFHHIENLKFQKIFVGKIIHHRVLSDIKTVMSVASAGGTGTVELFRDIAGEIIQQQQTSAIGNKVDLFFRELISSCGICRDVRRNFRIAPEIPIIFDFVFVLEQSTGQNPLYCFGKWRKFKTDFTDGNDLAREEFRDRQFSGNSKISGGEIPRQNRIFPYFLTEVRY